MMSTMELTVLSSSSPFLDHHLSPTICCRLPLPPGAPSFSGIDPALCPPSRFSMPDCLHHQRYQSSSILQRSGDGNFFGNKRFGHSVSRRGSARRIPKSILMENAVPPKQDFYTVGDFMTKQEELFVVKPSTTVDEALELLVTNRITGLPVVDDSGKLVGVVSDYDLLALDSISGMGPADRGLFPEAGSTWKAFREIQKLLSKTYGKTVAEVMTASPLVVREITNLEDAARLLLETKYRRLPVVDDSGTLVGLLTRGNVVRAALQVKRAAEKQAAAEGQGI